MVALSKLPSLRIRSKLIIAFLLVMVPLVLFHGVHLRESYEREKRTILAGQVQTSQAIAAAIRAYMSDLISREEWTADLIDDANGDEHQIAHRLSDLRATTPAVTSVAYIAPDSRMIASDPPGLPSVDLSDRTYFKQIVNEHRKWAISDLLVSRWDGSLAWVVASRVEDKHGNLLGLVVATLSPKSIEKAIGTNFGNRSTYAVIDSQGRAVYVNNLPDISWDERDWNWMPWVKEGLAGNTATFEGLVSRIDGVKRIGGIAPIEGINWVAGTAMTEDEALGPALRHILTELATLVFAAMLSVGVGVFAAAYFTRHLRSLSHHATKLAAGELGLRVNLGSRDELQELAEALNEMASRLQGREAENLRLIDSLKELEAKRKEFLSVLGHDLKTPLTVIKAWADLMLMEANKGVIRRREAEASTIIKSQVVQMLRLIDQLLDAAKAETGELRMNLEQADLVKIAEKVVTSLQATSDKHELCLHADNEVVALCDVSRMEQVLNNLISNAIKYSPDGGRVEVILECKDEAVHCAVRDEGIGIPFEQQPRVFDRFYRVERKQYREGLGLGLYICNQIVLQHEGRMWLDSTPGEGTTVHFTIPCRITRREEQVKSVPNVST